MREPSFVFSIKLFVYSVFILISYFGGFYLYVFILSLDVATAKNRGIRTYVLYYVYHMLVYT